MLILDNVTVRIAGRAVLDGASAAISGGRKVGLVGRNGAGKTTLLRLILGQHESETGRADYSRSWRVGSVAQEAPGGKETLVETVLAADTERGQLLARAEAAHDPLETAAIHARLNEIDAWAAPARAARILAGLGFSHEEQQRPCSEFSGGWRMRVALAALLFAAPDLLLLDEPTNYLDLEGSLWLEDHLRRYRGTVILVSHDRDLLNRAVDSILHLEHGRLTLYSGGYDTFAEAREQKRALDAASRAQVEAQRQRIQSFVDRFRYKASKARQAQSRLKWLERLKPVAIPDAETLPAIRLPQPDSVAPPLIRMNRVSAGYDTAAPVFAGVSLSIDSDDRVALLGRNGNGKSTLAKLMARRLQPFSGEMTFARKLVVGYFAQHQLDELDASKTPVEVLFDYRPSLDLTAARTRLGGFGFSGAKAETQIALLSGGEKARMLLAVATLDRPNLLILDEPTNHLDIDGREELLNALNDYEGAVLLISHDRRVIEACADRLLLVADHRVQPFEGDMDDYRDLILSRDESSGTEAAAARAVSKAGQRRAAADRRLQLKPLKDAMDKWEAEVTRLHSEIEKLDAELAAPGLFQRQPSKGTELSKLRADAARRLSTAEARWIDAAEQYESAQET
ncbi:MAG TPA: ABC-F family ATP-binding cassette domain-containing protein [Micropepsaceae bacterium]|nr:ABC-F family ATP-binding cassette domain-containing protein [Micropepsaceae bacterium]